MLHFLDLCFPISETVLLLFCFWFCFFSCFVFALNIIAKEKNMFKVRFESR